MPDQNSVNKPSSWSTRVKSLLVPTTILLMAAGIVFLIAGNWNTWASGRVSQQTDSLAAAPGVAVSRQRSP